MTIRQFIETEKPVQIWGCDGEHFIVRRHKLNSMEEVSNWLRLHPKNSLEFDMAEGSVKTARLPKMNRFASNFKSKEEIKRYLQRYGRNGARVENLKNL